MIGQNINGYEIIDSLGSGAFGHTYKVVKDNNIYAMKILKPEAMSNDIQSGGYPRFQREVRALQKVESKNVVKYFNSGIWKDKDIDHYFIVMEFVEGIDFNKYLKNHKTNFVQDENLMKSIYSGILDGLFDIHQKRIVM